MPQTITSIIATHQARMRCLLHYFVFDASPVVESFDDDNDELFDYKHDIKIGRTPNFTPNIEPTRDQTILTKMAIENRNDRYNQLPLKEEDEENDRNSNSSNASSDNSYTTARENPHAGVGGASCFGSWCKKKTKAPEIHRFQNGSVLKLSVAKGVINIELVYNGEVDEEKATYVYYVKPGTIDKNAQEGKYQIVEFHPLLVENKEIFKNVAAYTTYVFYLIRHGQGTHNILKGWSKANAEKDAKLTEAGKTQAKNTFNEFTKTEDNLLNNNKIDFVFASDLQRTHETLQQLYESMVNVSGGASFSSIPIIILPCSHELKYTQNAICDGGSQGMTPNENTSSYTYKDVSRNHLTPYTNVKWNYYTKFYGEGTRKNPGKEKHRCRDTSMIQLAIDFINKALDSAHDSASLAAASWTGGTPRRKYKTTRKRKGHRRSKKSSKKRSKKSSKKRSKKGSIKKRNKYSRRRFGGRKGFPKGQGQREREGRESPDNIRTRENVEMERLREIAEMEAREARQARDRQILERAREEAAARGTFPFDFTYNGWRWSTETGGWVRLS